MVVGRASQVILAQNPRALHVKIIAPFDLRCERIRQGREVTAEQAEELVQQHDRWRKQYLRNHHDADWDDLLLYHLTINTGKVDAEDAVDLIVRYANRQG